MKLNHLKAVVTVMILSSTMVAYQNCARANFTGVEAEGPSLKVEDSGLDHVIVVDDEVIDQIIADNQQNAGDQPQIDQPAASDQAATDESSSEQQVADAAPAASNDQAASEEQSNQEVVNNEVVADEQAASEEAPALPEEESIAVEQPVYMANSDLIECAISSNKNKVIFGDNQLLELSSKNSKASRVCMTENACLNLVNNYAAARSCSLSSGAAQSDSQGQCAKVFSGSKGTCKGALALTDASVEKILGDMAK